MINKEFYHLHIPKTGGTSLEVFLIQNVYPEFLKNNISIFKDDLNGAHLGWKPVNQNSYVVSSFRDPVKRIVSHFFWTLKLVEQFNPEVTWKNAHLIYPATKIRDYKNPTKKEFMSWIEKNNQYLSNYQCKNFFYREDDSVSPKFLNGCTSPLSIEEFNKEESINNILKTNILLKTNDIKIDTFRKIYYEILEEFDISYKNKNSHLIRVGLANKNEKSKIFYNTLTQEEINYIESLNIIDVEVYNTESLFWK
jgi:hypothetical protein